MNAFHHSQWRITPLCIPVDDLRALCYCSNRIQFKEDTEPSVLNYHLCLGKKWGQLPVPDSSDCPNTIAQPAPDQAHHLLTPTSWCQAQHLIRSILCWSHGPLLQDKWIDPPFQGLCVSGTYKLQVLWFGCHFLYLCKTSHLICFLREKEWCSFSSFFLRLCEIIE